MKTARVVSKDRRIMDDHEVAELCLKHETTPSGLLTADLVAAIVVDEWSASGKSAIFTRQGMKLYDPAG